jgi:hypothetical protein
VCAGIQVGHFGQREMFERMDSVIFSLLGVSLLGVSLLGED